MKEINYLKAVENKRKEEKEERKNQNLVITNIKIIYKIK
jgi:hypothetical protein